MLSRRKREFLARRVFAIISVLLILTGVGSLARGDLTSPNYWGGRVFAPLPSSSGSWGWWPSALAPGAGLGSRPNPLPNGQPECPRKQWDLAGGSPRGEPLEPTCNSV